MATAWIWAVIAVLASWLWRKQKKSSNVRLPPGPRGLPLLGNLLMLGQNPHRDLCNLSRKHGPVMYLRLGLVPAVVVSSPEAAEEVLKTHDLVFASRPPHEAAYHISYQQRNLSFAPYGSYWRNIRKMCTLELLSAHKMEAFKGMRREEVGLLVQSIKKLSSSASSVVDVTQMVNATSADMSCRMVVGKKFTANKEFEGFKAVIHRGMQLGALPNIGDFIPILAGLDLQGLTKQMKAVSKVFDDFLEKIVDEHLLHNPKTDDDDDDDGQTKDDFVHVMLGFVGSDEAEYRIDRPNVKAILLDMLLGSMDTSSTAIDWAMTELLRHPHLMNKVQKELEEAVGLERTVEESDLEKLHYLDMVIKETLRLHPVAPLLLPHMATEDCTVGGFLVPKRSRVMVNVWAIGRDPKVWTEPERFNPDRFEGSSVDVRGRDFQLTPFGSGRRGCPGLQLGLTVVRYVLAQLLHCFDWELPDGVVASELDMSEEFGLTMPRAKHLMAVPTYRLKV